jgi:hypothetical protein
MQRYPRKVLQVLAAAALLSVPFGAQAMHEDDPSTQNMHPLGHDEVPASLFHGPPDVHTDIAFWGRHAFQGSWLGFDIYDISAPGFPQPVSSTVCEGNQGDVVVWDDILVRSWNSPASGAQICDEDLVPAGFEGLHIFDISDLNAPVLVGSVDLSNAAIPGRCGSHTATGVPDLANDRLLIYNSGSGCDGIDIVEVPLDDPSDATYLRTEPAGRNCHDTGVILGDAMLAACAGGDGFTVWELDGLGTLENPSFLYSRGVPGVSIGHSAAFTWDGEVLVFGHEPGGGVGPNCQATSLDSDKTYFFFEVPTGFELGGWTLPRDQSNIENCTLHNLNVMPMRDGSYVLAHGSYQSGTSVVDFTVPAFPVEVAYSDPPAIVPIDLGGAWSSYWYNNFIYESNITEGLNVFLLSDVARAGAMRLDHLNPQTQEFTITPMGRN